MVSSTAKIGVAAVVVVCVFLLFRAYPATPPLAYSSSSSNTANTNAGADAARGKGTAGDAQTVATLRAQLEEIRALLKSGGGSASTAAVANAAASASLTSAAVPRSGSRTCSVCPQCSDCLVTKCPAQLPSSSSAVSSSSSSSSSSGGGKDRCAKLGLNFPPEITRLTLQVGPHMSPLTSEGTDHAVVTFEPQAHIVHHINEKRLPRVYAVPAAVSLYDGLAMFDLAEDHSQSASLNAFNPKIASWSGRKVLVPVLRLQTFLECLGERFQKIEYFLCDAQGSDLDVMKSAGPELKRFKRIEMEVQVNKFAYYQSDNSKASVVAFMDSQGFREQSSHCNGVDPATHARDPTICEEENVVFVPK